MSMDTLIEQDSAMPAQVAAALETMRIIAADVLHAPQGVADALRQYIKAIALVGMRARECDGVKDACADLHRYFAVLRDAPRALSPEEHALLAVWPEALAACMATPLEKNRDALMQVIEDCGLGEAIETSRLRLEPESLSAPVPHHELPEPVLTVGDEAPEPLAEMHTPDALPEIHAPEMPAEEAAVATEEVDSFTAVLMALEELSAIVAEPGFANLNSLDPDAVMRYAMSLMQLRESAEASGFNALTTACDETAVAVSAIMEASAGASAVEHAALADFPLRALDLACAQDAASEAGFVSSAVEPAEEMPLFQPLFQSAEEMPLFMEPEALPTVANGLDTVADSSAGLLDASADAPVASQQVNPEILGLLAAELAGVNESLVETLTVTPPDAAPEARVLACEQCSEIVDRLGSAAEAVGLPALHGALAHVSRNLREAGRGECATLWAQIAELPGRIGSYLETPTDTSACAGVVDVLWNEAWPMPLTHEAGFALTEALADVVFVDEPMQASTRPERAEVEDVSLALPDDLNPLLLESLLQELPRQMEAFTEAVQRIATGGGGLPDVEIATRAAHTLKGAANTVGVRGIANLTHHLEDILLAFTEQGALPGKVLSPMLMRASDCLEAMNESLQGVGEAPGDAQQTLQEVLDWANRIDREGLPTEDHFAPLAKREAAPSELNQAEPSQVGAVAPAEAQAMLRVSSSLVDELLRLVGETITANAQIEERLRLSMAQTQAVRGQNRLLHQLVGELDKLVDIRGVAAPARSALDAGGFDALEFENYSELHTVTNRLIEAVTDAEELSAQNEDQLTGLGDVLEVQSRLQLETQEAVMRSRMVRVATIVSRLQRGVRQASRLLDKDVAINVRGEETLIDSTVLNDLIDPLMHVLRNAVDHGIDDAASRRARGKDVTGRIDLSFAREGNAIAVRCRDDGPGLDLEAIKAAALARGLIDRAQVLAPADIARLILIPGFSTRNDVTQVSGRGIGMDIVNSRVLELKGSLSLHSEPGQGLMVELRIPLSMLSTHALLVRIRDRVLALSTRGIEDIRYVIDGQLKQVGTQWLYQVDDAAYDSVGLHTLLHLPGDSRTRERHSGFPILLVRQNAGTVRAVQLQEIIDSRNLVVKNLGSHVPPIPGVTGAAILGNGSVVAVIDLPDLLGGGKALSSLASPAHVDTDSSRALVGDKSARHKVLVVDDSLSARRATAQVMEDAGFVVRTAIDGLDAVNMLAKFIPDIILSDMEMPRMNGLELTSHVRAHDNTRQVPVIMITSRSTEKHRKQAQSAGVNIYLTKPFNDETLLQHVAALVAAGKA